jgi:hypothetical protein
MECQWLAWFHGQRSGVSRLNIVRTSYGKSFKGRCCTRIEVMNAS